MFVAFELALHAFEAETHVLRADAAPRRPHILLEAVPDVVAHRPRSAWRSRNLQKNVISRSDSLEARGWDRFDSLKHVEKFSHWLDSLEASWWESFDSLERVGKLSSALRGY